MKNRRQSKYILLAVLSGIVFIHSGTGWGIIGIFLPWVFAALIFAWMGGVGKIFYYRTKGPKR